jgi:hypothetical protein
MFENLIDGGVHVTPGVAKGRRVAAQRLLLRGAERIAGIECGLDVIGVIAGDAVQQPRGAGRLLELLYRGRGLLVARRAQFLGQRVARRGELVERQRVEVVRVDDYTLCGEAEALGEGDERGAER